MTRNFKRQLKRSSLLLAVGAFAGIGIGCGAAPAKRDAAAPTVYKVSHKAPAKEKKELNTSTIAKVRVEWKAMDQSGDLKMLAQWNDGVLLLKQRDGRSTLMSVANSAAGSQVEPRELLSFEGKVLGAVAHRSKLVLLRQYAGRVEFALGTEQGNALQLRTIGTYAADKAPFALGQFQNETMLFGKSHMARYDWDRDEVVELPKALPGELQQVTCGQVCIGLFKGQAEPMKMATRWVWEAMELQRDQETTDAASGPVKSYPLHINRAMVLRGEQLLYVANGLVFLSCDVNGAPLQQLGLGQRDAVKLLGNALARLHKDHIAMKRGAQAAHLELPQRLRKLSMKERFQLTQIQSLGQYLLLESKDTDDGYRRYHIALNAQLAANAACR